MKTPLRYAGGKSKAYDIITSYLPLLPNVPTRIVSPFIGGGSLESKWASVLGIDVVAYDVFDILINFWNILLSSPNQLADELSLLTPDKETYARVKEQLICWVKTQDMLKDWSTDYYKRTPIDLEPIVGAAYYFFNHNLSYGPMYLGWMSKIYENKEKWLTQISNIRRYRNPRLSVHHGDFKDILPNHHNDFLYLDPPYYLEKDDDNKMFKGIYPNANIDVHHSGFEHEKLRDLLHSHNGRFIMSYNNCETIREFYKGFRFEYPTWHYSYALGETRIGKNKTDNTPKESHEILIIKT
jgi:DNA adenine methylase